MERAIGRLKAAPKPGSAAWKAEAQKTAGILSRGVADLLASLAEPRESAPESHIRAQRFASVRVSEIQLYYAGQVRAGRAARDLYGALKSVLDAARSAYAEQFVTPTNGVPDYLHQEIVRALANNDAQLLGPHYPGPLV